LLSAFSHRQFLALNESNNYSEQPTLQSKQQDKFAICDSAGIYHAVESGFLDIIELHTGTQHHQKFPFELKGIDKKYSEGKLQISQAKLGDLYRISLRIKNKLDDLSDREKQVVAGICQGNTFKQIARNLGLSPSTVSNHLYRIYLKIGINSRSELVQLVKNNLNTL